jgi:hypothetical protein
VMENLRDNESRMAQNVNYIAELTSFLDVEPLDHALLLLPLLRRISPRATSKRGLSRLHW